MQTLTDALKTSGIQVATGLLLSAKECEWALWHGQKLSLCDAGKNTLLSEAYEARFFNCDTELRWRSLPQVTPGPAGLTGRVGVFYLLQGSEGIENRYTIWGKFDKTPGNNQGKGLSHLPRGKMASPASGEAGQILELRTCELVSEDEYGNSFVSDERWVALQVMTEKDARKALRARYKMVTGDVPVGDAGADVTNKQQADQVEGEGHGA